MKIAVPIKSCGFRIVVWSCFGIFLMSTSACQSLTLQGNDGGSEPLNEVELLEMQRSVNRCHRNGGSRVVKIKGALRCY